MPDNLNINTSAKKVENEKTKSQRDELNQLRQLKNEASTKAKQEQAKTKKKVEEQIVRQAETKQNNEELINLAGSAVSKLGKSAKKKVNNTFTLIKGIIIGVIIGFILATVLGFTNITQSIFDKVNEGKESVDHILDDHFLGYTALDFTNAVVGKAVEHQELIVMEQPLEVETTITKSGLGNLEIFSKVKNIKYSGRGVYTVDMSKIDGDHINVDMDEKVVTISIPHAILKDVILDVDKIQFDDTEKGILAFGDLSLTSEQLNEVEVSVKNTMHETLKNNEFFSQADEFATLKTWQIFQPIVSSVSPEFVVEMVFE